ncbi:hypothetical protein [Streptomyces lydicus]|uniref:hypothetical protein n=1 Tax=Streptomyces lydicus TaxID=47763 RepID=UPI0005248F52|nr:hypothetical protein [Streptomyces lydicus]MDC7336208.1 hypothetical protein [Streptomyces lydicus]UEG94484.1 hypothetical protein LJ741_30500 [Streptomyces lydicus]
MVPQDSGHRPDLRTDTETGTTTGIESTTTVDAGPSLVRFSRDEYARRVVARVAPEELPALVLADAVAGELALLRPGGDEEPTQ